jgi:plasmid stability protein
MKSLHIRDVDEATLARLRRLAALHHRSLQGEVRALLEEAARRAPEVEDDAALPITTVSVGSEARYRREDIYDGAR